MSEVMCRDCEYFGTMPDDNGAQIAEYTFCFKHMKETSEHQYCAEGKEMPDPPELTIRRAIDIYGHKMQTLVAMEELGELQHELSKFIRGSGDRDHLLEEFADVHIVMHQVREMYNLRDEEIIEMVEKKMMRLEERLDARQKDVLKSNRNE